MNIVIIGKSKINRELKDWCAKEGFVPIAFENIDDIKSFNGEMGKFVIKTSAIDIEAGSVIVTAESRIAKPKDDRTGKDDAFPSLVNIDNEEFFNNIINNNDRLPGSLKEPIVLILDYPCESPAYMTHAVLKRAIALARKKRKVICAARFIRTAAPGIEDLYMEARNMGITFIKYNDIAIDYSDEEGVYHIKFTDDFSTVTVNTRFVAAGNRVHNENIEKIVDKLKLRVDEDGCVNMQRYFMYPCFTNRKGIYFLDGGAHVDSLEDLALRIKYILKDIKNNLAGVVATGTTCQGILELPLFNLERNQALTIECAEIDAGKCAFCYTCFRVCPHYAMAPDYENSVMMNLENSCYACGICASACPANAITIKARKVVDLSEEPVAGSLEILCCENSGEIAVKMVEQVFSDIFREIAVTPLSCAGELSIERIFSSLKNNSKVLVLTCMDNACRHLQGNIRAKQKVERAREMLKAAGVDESRVEYACVSHAMPSVLMDSIDELFGVSRR